MANQDTVPDWQSRVQEIQAIKDAVNEEGKKYKKEKDFANAHRLSMKEDERLE